MADPRLVRRLEEVAFRIRRIRRLQYLTTAWMAALLLGPGLVVTGVIPLLWLWFVALAIAAFWGGLLLSRRRAGDLHRAATAIEHRFADLDAALLTAVAQEPDSETGRFGFLQEQVVHDALRHSRRSDWRSVVAASTLWRWRLCHLGALALFVASAGLLLERDGVQAGSFEAAVPNQPGAAGLPYAVTVEPGSVEVERGTSLLVMARFGGKLPVGVDLVAVTSDGRTTQVRLTKSLDDPLFGGRIPSVDADLKYHVEFDGERSAEYAVTTFVYPELLQADATIVPPEYTGTGEQKMQDVRRISVVEGSTVILTCQFNKPVAAAELIAADDTTHVLNDANQTGDRKLVELRPATTQRLRLVLTDADGRKNKEPPEFVIDVVPNLPPELKVAFPAQDTRVSPIEELVLQARAQDDFGIQEYGLVLEKPDGTEENLVLGASAPRAKPLDVSHLLALESLNAEPNQLVSYYFYADDVGPDGVARRTFSDMFFAEVRHFEEIFRQMPSQQGQDQQQQQGQQQQGQGQSAQLLDLQKQIITATWNIMRRFPTTPADAQRETFHDDVETVAESQLENITRTEQMAAEQQDVLLRQFADEAVDHMQRTAVTLQRAAGEFSQAPLPDARSAAQAAYQSLLRLQAREFLVRNQQQNSQQSQSQQANQQRQQRQLDQLELKNDRNRYEQQRQARQEQQEQQNREEMQALNRLRELARRQEDLNKRIRELENKLREAQSEEEREETTRQLKRLQEEQQELLRDVDELRERMNQPENRMEMANERAQLDETRENVRRTSEALQAGQTSQALNSGTRAERELQELRDEFRRRTAGDFAETMEQMRQDARELAEREREIGTQLNQEQRPDQRRTLRDTDDREQLADSLDEQQSRLNELMEQMREVVEQSEESEPLLSKNLYDTYRETYRNDPATDLREAGELLRRGFPQEGSRSESEARREIENLQAGVEKAAESVLGDETEALRRAEGELQRLTEDVESELAQAAEGSSPPRASQERDSTEQQRNQRGAARGQTPPESDEQPSDRRSGQPDDGRPPGERDGETRQPGQGVTDRGEQDGERQPGQPPRPGQPPEGRQPDEQDRGTREGQQQDGQQQQGDPQAGEQSGQGQQSDQQSGEGGQPRDGTRPRGGNRGSFPFGPFLTGGEENGAGTGGYNRPFTGEDWREWSDNLRDVEEMLADPELRAEAAKVRERAREIRREVEAHSEAPNWELVRTSVYGPLLDLRQRIADEIARRTPDEELVPIDRDPVPQRYSDLVREYYERLGAGRPRSE